MYGRCRLLARLAFTCTVTNTRWLPGSNPLAVRAFMQIESNDDHQDPHPTTSEKRDRGRSADL